MTQDLRRRGPDSGGLYAEDRIGLGHRRLSILGLSPASHQPMIDAYVDRLLTDPEGSSRRGETPSFGKSPSSNIGCDLMASSNADYGFGIEEEYFLADLNSSEQLRRRRRR